VSICPRQATPDRRFIAALIPPSSSLPRSPILFPRSTLTGCGNGNRELHQKTRSYHDQKARSRSEDHVVPRAASEHILSVLPAAELVEIPGPHMLLQLQPVECAEVVTRFLETLQQ
jgi:hypothetical protein